MASISQKRNQTSADGKPLADVWFNAYREPATPRARAWMTELVGQLESVEPPRKRKRKAKDKETFAKNVTALVSDLVHFHLSSGDTRGGGLTLTRSNKVLGNKDRYRPSFQNKTTPKVLDLLASPEIGLAVQVVGTALDKETMRRLQTVIRPGPRLETLVHERQLDLSDFTTAADAECVVLKRYAPKDFTDGGQRTAGPVAYDDTAKTHRYRKEMQAINAWLRQADISFDRREAVKADIAPTKVDVGDRNLRRIFTRGRKKFDNGGRLFGGFWQWLPKSVRLSGLRIEGERVVGLDYGALNPRIAYSLARAKVPKRDPYAIPGLEQHRAGVKKIFNAMLFISRPLGRWPDETRELFPKEWKVRDVVAAIEKAHPELRKLFNSEIGHRIQFIESEIITAVLLSLKAQRVVALPVHDAVVVKKSKAKAAKAAMLTQFKKIVGVDAVVSEENA